MREMRTMRWCSGRFEICRMARLVLLMMRVAKIEEIRYTNRQ